MNLPNDVSRCHGKPDCLVCQTCERFKQIERDKQGKGYPVPCMSAQIKEGKCDYRIAAA